MVVVCTDITLLIRVSSSQLVQRGSKTPEKKLVHYHSLGRKSWRTEKNSSERKKKTATNEVDRKSWLVTYLEKEQNFGKKPSLNYLVKTVTVKLQERAAASRSRHEDVQSSVCHSSLIQQEKQKEEGDIWNGLWETVVCRLIWRGDHSHETLKHQNVTS